MHDPRAQGSSVLGGLCMFGSVFLWGLLPLYWRALAGSSAMEILAHRMLWTLVFVMLLISFQRRWAEFRNVFTSWRSVVTLAISSVVITFNWLTYIWAVNHGYVIETSLGYYIMPLMNVMLGVVFLKERLNRWQKLSVLLAALGVGIFLVRLGYVPWVALALSSLFAFYGILRKLVGVESLVGLGVETVFIAPLALILVVYFSLQGEATFGASWRTTLLMMGTGVITAMPLIWFAIGIRRLKLTTVGFFQYINPTLQLLLGVFLFDEPFTSTHLMAFGLIWVALLIFSLQSLLYWRSRSHLG